MLVDVSNSIEHRLPANDRLPEMKLSLGPVDSPTADPRPNDFKLMSHPPLIRSGDMCDCHEQYPHAKMPAQHKLTPQASCAQWRQEDSKSRQDDVREQSPRVQDASKPEIKSQESEQDISVIASNLGRHADKCTAVTDVGNNCEPLFAQRSQQAQQAQQAPAAQPAEDADMCLGNPAQQKEEGGIIAPRSQWAEIPDVGRSAAVPINVLGSGAIRPLQIQPMTHLDVCSNSMDPHLVVSEPAWRHYVYLKQHTWWDSSHSSTSPTSSCASTSTAGSGMVDTVYGFDPPSNVDSNHQLQYSSRRLDSRSSQISTSTSSLHSPRPDAGPSRMASEQSVSLRPGSYQSYSPAPSAVMAGGSDSGPTIEDRMELEEILHSFEEFYVPRNVVRGWAVLVETVHDPPEMMQEENVFVTGWREVVSRSRAAAQWMKQQLE